MTTIYHPRSCDCQVAVERAEYIERCNLHVRSNDVRDCYDHNLDFSNRSPNANTNTVNLRVEKARIRLLPRPTPIVTP